MQLQFLRPLYQAAGPWASLYLDASRDTGDAGKAVELRWRAARDELTRQGADERTLDALQRAVGAEPTRPGRYGLVAFARAGQVPMVEPTPAPPAGPLAVWSPLPHVMPLVAQRGEQVAWLRVLADRTGADLTAASAGQAPRTREVTGASQYPIRKVGPGGWAQSRFQREAETTWERNAGEVAAAVAEMADACGAEVLVVAGDAQARRLLVEQLPERWRHRAVQTEAGSRAPGADPAPLDDAMLRAVAEVGAQRVAEVLDRFRQQRGHDAAAGTGLGAVVAALQRGQIDTVLLVDDPSSTATLWVGPDPLQVALTEGDARAMGVDEPLRVPADDALLRGLVATDGELVLVDPAEVDLDGGVGALLRYADAATRHR